MLRHAIAPSVFTAALFLLSSTVGATPPDFARPYAEGRILVKPAAGLSQDKFDKILRKAGGKEKRKLKGLSVGVVEASKGNELALAKALNRNPHIAYATVDYRYDIVATVNDPYYDRYQWHLPLMRAPDAWGYSEGAGVTVAVLDTGVYPNHPDLSGKILSGVNTVSNNSDTSDFDGHGTMVSGVIAAHTNNLTGGASVAPATKILPIRITNDGWAYSSDMAEGIVYAADHGARVANISFSGAAGDPTVWNAASYMMSKGGVVVVAAANDGTDLGYSNSPYVFTAAATDPNDVRTDFSNYGRYVDIAAPGQDVFTTNKDGGYSLAWGTSFSSPNVAAVAALVMAANPSLTATDVLAVLEQTAVDLGSSGWDPEYGFGRVDALGAVQLATNVVPSDRTAPTVAISSPNAYEAVSDLVSVIVSASDDFGVESVTLLVDGRALATETQEISNGSYVFAWDSTTVSDGNHRLTAQAVDAAGNVGKSSDVYVDVANAGEDAVAPVAVITSPADGAVVSKSVELSGYGIDDQQIAQVSLYVDGQLICSGTTNASCRFNLRKVSDGAHTASAKATDAAGNTHTDSVTFHVGSSDSTSTDTSTDPSTSPSNNGKGRKK